MEALFLGTGSAWALPEHGCECHICRNMVRLGEERLRTALFFRAAENLLVDCGPDIRVQLRREEIRDIDAILITHGHGDHYIGLDELEALRRSCSPGRWSPIPTFATEGTWRIIEQRFGYLIGKLVERRIARPGAPLGNLKTRVVPFETIHNDSAEGSVGYVLEEETREGRRKIVYTSDFVNICHHQEVLVRDPEVLIVQTNFFNEPIHNQPGHMSFQRGLEFIRRWQPKTAVFLVHISDADTIPGDGANRCFKKVEPSNPMKDPRTGLPYAVPTCQGEWQKTVDQIRAEHDLPCRITVAYDGLRASLW